MYNKHKFVYTMHCATVTSVWVCAVRYAIVPYPHIEQATLRATALFNRTATVAIYLTKTIYITLSQIALLWWHFLVCVFSFFVDKFVVLFHYFRTSRFHSLKFNKANKKGNYLESNANDFGKMHRTCTVLLKRMDKNFANDIWNLSIIWLPHFYSFLQEDVEKTEKKISWTDNDSLKVRSIEGNLFSFIKFIRSICSNRFVGRMWTAMWPQSIDSKRNEWADGPHWTVGNWEMWLESIEWFGWSQTNRWSLFGHTIQHWRMAPKEYWHF